MKNRKSEVGFISIAMVILMIFASCTLFTLDTGVEGDNGGSTPTDDTVTITGAIIDGKTASAITGDVTLSFTGTDKDKAATAAGAVNGTLNISDGTITFSLKDEIAALIDFTIVAQTEGYIGNSVRINNVTADYTFTLKLTKITDTPTGVSVKQETIGTADSTTGAISTEVVISTDSSAETKETAEITIAAGTRMLDTNGDPLSGELTATVGYFSPKEEDALRVFPGGFDVSINDPDTSTTDSGYFVTGGFVSIDITDSSGRSAETFDGATLGVNVDIPSDLINPETGDLVKAGDIIPLWSYNPETGEWTKEAEVTRNGGRVINDEKGLKMSFNVPHLSYWNIDWFNPSKIDESQPIVFTGDGIAAGESFTLKLYSPTRGFLKEKSTSYDGKELILQNVPSFPLTITILDNEGTVLGEVKNATLGDEGNLEILITKPTGSSNGSTGDATLDVDFTKIGHQIGFTLDGVELKAESFAYPMNAWYKAPYHYTQYTKEYYDALRGDYNGPYSYAIDDEGSCYFYGFGLNDSAGKKFMVFYNAASQGIQLHIVEYDAEYKPQSIVMGYVQTEIALADQYAVGDTVEIGVAKIENGRREIFESGSRSSKDQPDNQTLKKLAQAIMAQDVRSIQKFKKQYDEERSAQAETRSGSRSSIPVSLSTIIIKTKLIEYFNDLWSNDIWVYSDYSYEDAKVRTDYPIEIVFDTSDMNDRGPMDTSIKDLYVNDVLVQGVWTKKSLYDETVDVLVYAPDTNWEQGQDIYIDIPEYHKTTTEIALHMPHSFYLQAGSGSVSEIYDFEIEADDLFEIYLRWYHETSNENISFEILRSESATGPFALICDILYNYEDGGTEPNVYYRYNSEQGYGSFQDKDVVEGTTYYYKIKTTNNVTGETLESDVQSATAIDPIDGQAGTLYEGLLNYSGENETDWYRFPVEVGKSYAIMVDHATDGSGRYDADVEVSAHYLYTGYDNDTYLTNYFWNEQNLYTIPKAVTAENDTLFINVSLDEYTQENRTYALKITEMAHLEVPADFSAVNGTGSIDLSWTDNTSCDLFYIYRETEFSDDFVLLGSTEQTSYSDDQIEAGLVYDYRLVARKGDDFSENVDLRYQVYFTGISTTEIIVGEIDIDGIFDSDFYDSGMAAIYSFITEPGKEYLIQKNNGDNGPYSHYDWIYLYDATGKKVNEVYSNRTFTAETNKYYLVFTDYYSDQTFSLGIYETVQ